MIMTSYPSTVIFFGTGRGDDSNSTRFPMWHPLLEVQRLQTSLSMDDGANDDEHSIWALKGDFPLHPSLLPRTITSPLRALKQAIKNDKYRPSPRLDYTLYPQLIPWDVLPGMVVAEASAPMPCYQMNRSSATLSGLLMEPEPKEVVIVDSAQQSSSDKNDLEDMACAQSQGPDPLMACQIKCTSENCQDAVHLCLHLRGCTHASYDVTQALKNTQASRLSGVGRAKRLRPAARRKHIRATLKKEVSQDERQEGEFNAKIARDKRLGQCLALGKWSR